MSEEFIDPYKREYMNLRKERDDWLKEWDKRFGDLQTRCTHTVGHHFEVNGTMYKQCDACMACIILPPE
jgi:hypothetical protein